MFRKVLVPIDDSLIARKAANVAIDLAKRMGAELLLISVVPLPEHAGTVGEVAEAKAEGESKVSKYLLEFQKAANLSGIKAGAKILFGHPAHTILKYATEGRFDLIVIGYKGASAIQRFLLGSVSTAIAEHAQCTVMIIK